MKPLQPCSGFFDWRRLGRLVRVTNAQLARTAPRAHILDRIAGEDGCMNRKALTVTLEFGTEAEDIEDIIKRALARFIQREIMKTEQSALMSASEAACHA